MSRKSDKPDQRITSRAREITPFYVMELLEKAKEMEARGEHIIHMEVGEPDFATPRLVRDAGVAAIEENRTFYTHSLGIPELRERISAYYRTEEGVDVDPGRVVITNGTSGAFLLLFGTLLDENRSLVLSDPGYPCYRNFATLLKANVTPVNVSESTGFEITPSHLSHLEGPAHVLLISHPSNPTGAVYREETVRGLHDYVSRTGGILIVDEIYLRLTYGRKVQTSLAVSDEIVVVNGFSKSHAMTGWRLGWMVVPETLVRPVQKIAQNVYISPPSVSQYAAVRAFDVEEELGQMVNTYRQRRDFMLPELRRLGFHIPVDPEGAFYVYAGISRWGIDSMEFVERALKEGKIALTPGYDFGSFKAGSHVRFSYANSLEALQEGCRRLERWLGTL
jgi:aspartate/methionine/tyrosine aminotransferase